MKLRIFKMSTVILSAGQWQPTVTMRRRFNFFRGSVGVRHGRPETMLDAANYAKKEWDKDQKCLYNGRLENKFR